MSFYNKSSLLTIPTAYKQGKLYSVKPDDGSGDFTFTRSTSATRVNSDGLIEKGRENLLLQSNSFSTTPWVLNNGATLTSGQAGYDGTNDAWLLTKPASGFTNVAQAMSTSGVVTFSIYAKAGTLSTFNLRMIGTDEDVLFDLSAGSVSTSTSGVIHSEITAISSGWYRCSFSAVWGSGAQLGIYVGDVPDSTAGNIYIQDAQLEAGLVATDYIETTTSTVATGITTNVPRIDYLNGTPALLLEPQRTNLIRYSEIFEGYSSGYWQTFDNGTIETNYGISPQGIQNSTKIGTSGGSNDFVYSSITVSIGTVYTTSCYVKNIDATKSLIYGVHSANNNLNWSGSQLVSIDNAEFEEVGNGWYRIWITSTATLSSNVFRIYSDRDVSAGSIEVYGFQVEVGSYPTSYIPTYGTSVTRTNEFGIITDTLGKGLITATEFTLFIDLNTESLIRDSSIVNFLLGDVAANGIFIYNNALNAMNGIMYLKDSSITQTVSLNSSPSKICVKVQPNNVKVFINGIYVYTFTSLNFDFTANSNLVLQSGSRRQIVNKLLFFPTALTDAECITLTTI